MDAIDIVRKTFVVDEDGKIRTQNPIRASDLSVMMEAYADYKLKSMESSGEGINERKLIVDSIYQILGQYNQDREDIKSDFRKLCKHLTKEG